MDINRGAEWRRWDLHVHTPYSALANDFSGASIEDKWERYIDALEAVEGVSVVGVTDYYSISGYEKILEYKSIGRLNNFDNFLPNVELRLLVSTVAMRAVNLHVIFSPDVVPILRDNFFAQLKFDYCGASYACTYEDIVRLGRRHDSSASDEISAYKAGVNQFKVNHDDVRAILKNEVRFKNKYLVCIPNSNNDGNSGIKDEQYEATRRTLYNFADCIFSSNPRDRAYFLGKGVDSVESIIEKYGKLKPCIHGSDAHSLDTLCCVSTDRYTWIKAAPTFEGLRQIVFEPEERVAIQASSPREATAKTHFSHVKLGGAIFQGRGPRFAPLEIPLNENMCAIIGGRGAGKSLFLDVMFDSFRDDKVTLNGQDRVLKFGSPIFDVSVEKSDGTSTVYEFSKKHHNFEYLHVRQSEVKSIVEDENLLSTAIMALLNLEKDYRAIDRDRALHDIALEQERLRDKLIMIDDQGRMVNTVEYQEKEKEKRLILIATLTTKSIEGKIVKFTQISSDMSSCLQYMRDVESLISRVVEFSRGVDEGFRLLNIAGEKLGIVVESADLTAIVERLRKAHEYVKGKIGSLELEKNTLTEEFKSLGLLGDVSSLLSRIDSHQREAAQCDVNIQSLKRDMERIDEIKRLRLVYAERIVELYDEEAGWYKKKFLELVDVKSSASSEHGDIIKELLCRVSISGECSFDVNNFYAGLRDFFDGRKLRGDVLKEIFPIKSVDDFWKLIVGMSVVCPAPGVTQTLDEFVESTTLFLKSNLADFYDYFYHHDKRKRYLHVRPIARYMEKELSQLSVGQRGTFYVCLKLATSAFLSPFVFDQPEDDLDNEFIVNELQPIFRKIKKYRQVIIVTHNANLVVNADAEQVIVACNDNEEIGFMAGALEESYIRTSACKVLEGGERAFKKRELRYCID